MRAGMQMDRRRSMRGDGHVDACARYGLEELPLAPLVREPGRQEWTEHGIIQKDLLRHPAEYGLI